MTIESNINPFKLFVGGEQKILSSQGGKALLKLL